MDDFEYYNELILGVISSDNEVDAIKKVLSQLRNDSSKKMLNYASVFFGLNNISFENENQMMDKDIWAMIRYLSDETAILFSSHVYHLLVALNVRMSAVVLDGIDYKKYIKSNAWKIRRELFFELRGHACEFCGERANLLDQINVHHKHYRTLGMEMPEDVLILCEGHHLQIHNYWKHYKAIGHVDYLYQTPPEWWTAKK